MPKRVLYTVVNSMTTTIMVHNQDTTFNYQYIRDQINNSSQAVLKVHKVLGETIFTKPTLETKNKILIYNVIFTKQLFH